MLSVTDLQGRPVRVDDAEMILDDMERYVSGKDMAFTHQVDLVIIPPTTQDMSEQGVRKYPTKTDTREYSVPIESRMDAIKTCVKHQRAEIVRLRQKGCCLMDGSFNPVGFTSCPKSRKVEYETQANGNLVLSLWEVCAEFRFPGQYKTNWNMLYLAGKKLHSNMMEVMMTRLNYSHMLGYGFNSNPPGRGCEYGR